MVTRLDLSVYCTPPEQPLPPRKGRRVFGGRRERSVESKSFAASVCSEVYKLGDRQRGPGTKHHRRIITAGYGSVCTPEVGADAGTVRHAGGVVVEVKLLSFTCRIDYQQDPS